MKFGCDKCNTRYSIADERVRGRVLKIRCKACNNVITVREELPVEPAASSMEDALSGYAADDEHTRVSMGPPGLAEMGGAPGAPASNSGGDDWYISFDGEQEGPLPLARALDRVRLERPRGKECFCWRAGFFVWLPVDEVPEFAQALVKPLPAAPVGPPPKVGRSTGSQAAVRPTRTTGQQPVVKSPTGSQPALGKSTGSQPALGKSTGSQPALGKSTGSQPALGKSTGSQPALGKSTGPLGSIKSPTGKQPALASSQPAMDLPPVDSGPLGTPGSLLPSLETRPEPRLQRKPADESALPLPAALMPAVDSAPSTVSPFAAALQASGPTQVASAEPRHESAPRSAAQALDSGPVPLPPPPGNDLPIGEVSGLVSLGHLSKPSLTSPKDQNKPVVETFGGVLVTPSVPTPGPHHVVVMSGAARGAAGWMKWAALGGALATVSLLVVVVVLMGRKPTVIVVPPAPTLDDGRKADDKPITVADPGPSPTQGAAPPSAGDVKRPQKRPSSSARAAASVKPPVDKDGNLNNSQRNLASLYRDEGSEHGARQGSAGDSAGRAGGGQVSQQAIMSVVTQNRRSLNLCYDRVLKHDSSLKSGRVVTHVKVGISGSVTGVSLPDPQYASSELGQCIAQTIRHWHFPSADAEYETEFPIILQAN